jgi:spore coat polysaccharide biosynthesis protein SpsF (cytidylyltransferase family)
VTVGAVVHARMGSARLAGKVLGDLAGRPALDWLFERLAHAGELDRIVLATSTGPDDDPVAEFGRARGLAVHRGPLHDVAARVLGAADAFGLDAVVRVNGDSPVLDQRLVDRGVELLRASGADLVSNVRPRSFPPGQSVEVLRTEILRAAVARMHDDDDREHVTGWLYRHPEEVRIVRFEHDPPVTAPRLTLDEPADHARLEALLSGLERPHWDYRWDELVARAC